MSHQDFTIEKLATLLQRTPSEIRRMADRGKLTGRKVGGEWVFAAPEVRTWIELEIERLLLFLSEDSGSEDRSEMERLRRILAAVPGDPSAEEPDLRLVKLLVPEAVAVPLVARTRRSVFTEMIDLAMQTGLLWDRETMLDAVMAREELFTTAIENGVALLHSRNRMPQILGGPFLTLGISGTGVHFAPTEYGRPTDIFFLIAAMDDRSHLQILARLSRVLSMQGFLDELRQSPDATTVLEQIRAAEAELDA